MLANQSNQARRVTATESFKQYYKTPMKPNALYWFRKEALKGNGLQWSLSLREMVCSGHWAPEAQVGLWGLWETLGLRHFWIFFFDSFDLFRFFKIITWFYRTLAFWRPWAQKWPTCIFFINQCNHFKTKQSQFKKKWPDPKVSQRPTWASGAHSDHCRPLFIRISFQNW